MLGFRCWKCNYLPNHEFREGDYCPECGASQADPTCPNCGEVVRRDQKFCRKCGTKLENEE